MYDPMHDQPEEGTEPTSAYINQDPDIRMISVTLEEAQRIAEQPEKFTLPKSS